MKAIHFRIHSLWEDIKTTLLANLTLGLVILEQTRFPAIMPTIHLLFLMLTVYFWCSIAFKNGTLQRFGFLLYTSLFFVSSQLLMLLFDYLVKLRIYNKYLDWLNQLMKFVVIHPYKSVIDFMFHQYGLTIHTTVTLIMLVYCACFYLGYSVYMTKKKKV